MNPKRPQRPLEYAALPESTCPCNEVFDLLESIHARISEELQRASDIAIEFHSKWEDRGQGIVAGLTLASVIVRDAIEQLSNG